MASSAASAAKLAYHYGLVGREAPFYDVAVLLGGVVPANVLVEAEKVQRLVQGILHGIQVKCQLFIYILQCGAYEAGAVLASGFVCQIGQEFVPAVELKGLTQIVLEILSSMNKLSREKERLIDIAADGKISDEELPDFARIRYELQRISSTVDAMQLWVNNTIAANGIDKEKLDRLTEDLTQK